MSLALTYLGHSAFLASDGQAAVALDPFLTGNPVATTKAADLKCRWIVLTHGHSDHLGDTVAVARANRATVFAGWEICQYLDEQKVATEPGNPGGKITAPFGWVAFTQAFHSSSYEGRYLGTPCGVMLHLGGVTLYHTGDTALFGDMALLGEIYRPDIALICAGDRFTMGPELATRAAELVKPKVAVPIHWGTWPLLAQDMSGFRPRGVEVKLMKPGQTLTYPT